MEIRSNNFSTAKTNGNGSTTRWVAVFVLVVLFLAGLIFSYLFFRARLDVSDDVGPNVFEIRRVGAIVIGTDSATSLLGIDRDLSLRIASQLGLEPEIEFYEGDKLFEALNTKEVDIVVSGITYSDEIVEQYDVSSSYFVNGGNEYVVLFRKGDFDLVVEINRTLFSLRNQGVLEAYEDKRIGI